MGCGRNIILYYFVFKSHMTLLKFQQTSTDINIHQQQPQRTTTTTNNTSMTTTTTTTATTSQCKSQHNAKGMGGVAEKWGSRRTYFFSF